MSFLPKNGLAAAMAAACCAAGAQTRPLNVLMIALDDQNIWAGCMGFNSQAVTPNIDRLASQGVLFKNAYSVVPCCNPSRAALMTGQRPETTGQFGNEGSFRSRPGGAERVTLPQHFREHGYEAVAAGKLFHEPRGGNRQPDPRSDPQSWDQQWTGWPGTGGHNGYLNDAGFAKWHGGKFKGSMGRLGVWGPCPEPKEQTGDWNSAGYIADYLQQKHDKPFFAACGIFRPHAPWLVPQEYLDRFPLDSIRLPECPPDDFSDIPRAGHENFSTGFFVDGVKAMGQWRLAVQAYLACMAFADDCVGRVLDALEQSPYRDNTVVVLWSDNGYHLGTKNRWAKFTLWREGAGVLLMVKAPGVTSAGTVCERAASLLDLYPTLSELCGLPVRPELEGRSLVPLLKNPRMPWEYPAVVTDYWRADYSVVHEQWNYIRYYDGSEELYDHSKDPGEFTNLAGNPEYSTVKARLARWFPTREQYPEWRTHEEERARDKTLAE